MKEAMSAAEEARTLIAEKKSALEAASKERTDALLQVGPHLPISFLQASSFLWSFCPWLAA